MLSNSSFISCSLVFYFDNIQTTYKISTFIKVNQKFFSPLKSKKKNKDIRSGPGWSSVLKQGKSKYFKNTPEDDLDTFCEVMSHLTSKYHLEFFVTSLSDRTSPDLDEH